MKEMAELGTWSPCDRGKGTDAHSKHRGKSQIFPQNCQGTKARTQDSVGKANSLGKICRPKAFLHETRQPADGSYSCL